MAEVLNNLKDFEIHQVPRIDRSGGGVGILLRKAFKVTRNDSIPLPAMGYMDLTISHGTSSIRLVTIYRPPSSKKKRSTPEAFFFTDFSMLLETLILVSDYLLLTGHFNFHMDKENDASVNVFRDLLESASLEQHITVPILIHRSGHTLDLIIDRQEDTKLSEFCVLDDLPSDHICLIRSLAFAKPVASKSQYKQCRLRDIDMEAFKRDILHLSHLCQKTTASEKKVAEPYNSELRKVLDKHAPELCRAITLGPHAPWYTAELRDLKREKRRWERVYRSSGLEEHRQIYHEQCRKYTALVD